MVECLHLSVRKWSNELDTLDTWSFVLQCSAFDTAVLAPVLGLGQHPRVRTGEKWSK